MSSNSQNEMKKDWPEVNQFRRSIRLEFSAYVAAMLLAVMIVSGYIMVTQFGENAADNVIEKLLVQARSYSQPASKLMLSENGPDALLLNNICKKLMTDDSDINWVGITDNSCKFIAHSDISQVISEKQLPSLDATQQNKALIVGESFLIAKDSVYLVIPITENGIQLGHLGMSSSTRQIIEARSQATETVIYISITVLIVGLLVTTLIVQRKLRPISIIVGHLKAIDFDDISFNIPVTARNEFGYLAETIKMMGLKLNIAQKGKLERERVTRELEIAREIQKQILPKNYPRSEMFEFEGMYRSAREVGGDYYDFIDHGNGQLAFLVADVSGKSLPGMLIMLLTRDIVQRLALQFSDPAGLLSKVNEELLANIKRGMFVTMFYGVLDKTTGHFSFASAGHNPLIKIDAATGAVELIKTKGYPLGMMPPEAFRKRIEVGHLDLKSGDWMIQYTDGINEARNSEGAEFGMERFVKAVTRYTDLTAGEMIRETVREHQTFIGEAEQFDDLTLLSLKWAGNCQEKNLSLSKGAEVEY